MAYSTIPKSSSYFNTVLYNGTGSSQSITGVGFQPDWLWQKHRSGSQDSRIFDAVRGGSKVIYSSLTNGETTDAQLITSFDSDGFTMGSSGTNVNDNGTTNVAWNWKANGSGSANGDGSISSTVSVDTTSGFSIVQYVGTGSAATVGHGLGTVPKMMLVKKTSGSESWAVYHHSIGNTKFLQLNTSGAEGTSSGFWNDTTPTSSVFSIKSDGGTNASGETYIAYCFSAIPGYSKFELYEGTGNSDGPFLYTGFKPSFVMIKAKGQTESWYMLDNKRPGYNTNNYYLAANTSSAEGTSTTLATTLCSNGFKINNSDTSMNSSGQGYIYMAFGQPIVSTNGDIATAR